MVLPQGKDSIKEVLSAIAIRIPLYVVEKEY
jgi:hypothetical protein